MTLIEARMQVKIEAGVKDYDALDSYVDAVLNRKLAEYTSRRLYQELFAESQISVVTSGLGTIALPTNIQHWKGIQNEDGLDLSIWPRTRRHLSTLATPATHYYLSGANIVITPQAALSSGDIFTIFYYKYPTKLVLDADLFPIRELEGTVIAATAALVATKGGDPKQFEIQKKEEVTAFIASR